MGTFLHKFDTTAEFEAAYNDPDVYREPWVSLTEGQVNFNNPNPPSPVPPVPPTPVYPEEYLTFKIKSDGNIIWQASNTGYTTTISYSKDNGSTWTDVTSDTGESAPSISVVNGDVVLFKGNNDTYSSGYAMYNCFSGTSCQFEVEGNIMSLLYGDNFKNQTTLNGICTFIYLFSSCTGLTSAENLILPATTLTNGCYFSMFKGCTSLTITPELPATTLDTNCYKSMFYNCTSLTTALSILPATTLAYNCYQEMFYNCTSLTTAPELPATTLVNYCYQGMFRSCTSLNYIKCLAASNMSASYCKYTWVQGVSASGKFIKNPNIPIENWGRGNDGIPYNWTVEDA